MHPSSNLDLSILEEGMRACFQFQDMNMIDHGLAVNAKYMELIDAIKQDSYPEGWLKPKWWTSSAGQRLLELQPSLEQMYMYQKYHDCGKHLCRTVDEEGRQHFPGHAQVSAEAYRVAGGDVDTAWLIEHDMLLHTGSCEECEPLMTHRLMPALILTAIAELHANAEMFGGVQSPGAKAKFKHIARRGGMFFRN